MRFMEWVESLWKHLSLIGDLSHAKVSVFSDSVFRLGKMNQNPESNSALEDKLSWFKDSPQCRTLDTIDGESREFEWNIFARIHYIAALQQSPRVPVKNGRSITIQRTNYLHVDVQ